MSWRALPPLFALVTASACQSDLTDLRADPREKYAFHIAAPYPTVRANIENTLRHCHKDPIQAPLNRFEVEATETAPGHGANIAYWHRGMSNEPLLAVDVVEKGDGADVTFYRGTYAIWTTTDYKGVVRGWAMGAEKCGGPFAAKPAAPPDITPLPDDTVITPL